MNRLRTSFLGLATLLSVSFATGCNYVHLGRQPATARELTAENARLGAEKTKLQQELALSQQQGSLLRAMFENRPGTPGESRQLLSDLNETTRQLATLRTEYARLQSEKAAPAAAGQPEGNTAAVRQQLADTENKLAAAMRTYTSLQQENAGLRTQLDRTQSENANLTTQVSTLNTKNKEAQATLSQISSELLAQQRARAQVAQEADSLRTQLGTANEKIATLTAARSGSAGSAQTLSSGLAMNAETAAREPTARLETSADRVRPRAPATPAGVNAANETDALINELSTLRARVSSLETERANLQKLVATSGSTGTPAGVATSGSDADRLAMALRSFTLLQDENDSLRAQSERVAAEKAVISAELARTKGSLPLASQANALRDQLRETQGMVASLSDENAQLKNRLTQGGASPTQAQPSRPGAPAQTAAALPASAPATRTHVIAAGDTLAGISRQYYGTDTRWTEILAANRDILRDERSLVIGRVIKIP